MKRYTRDPAILVKNRNEVIEEMKDRYGYLFCEVCKRSSGFYKLHVHHLIFRSEAPNHENLHSKENLCICCNDCHTDFHSGDKDMKRIRFIKERGLDKKFPELIKLK